MNNGECLEFIISCLEQQGYTVSYHIRQDRGEEHAVLGPLTESQQTLTITATRRVWDGN